MDPFVIFIALFFYLFPSVVAGARKHSSGGAIFLVNLLFGWTAIGWIGALIWALTSTGTPQQQPMVIIQNTNGFPQYAPPPQFDEFSGRPRIIEAQARSITTKSCDLCANPLRPGARFCGHCGTGV